MRNFLLPFYHRFTTAIVKFQTVVYLIVNLFGLMPMAAYGATALNAGDIAFLSVIGTNPDTFSFVMLKDIENGTIINVTDQGWLSTSSFRVNEGVLQYIASSNQMVGSIITYTDGGTNIGWTKMSGATDFALSASGDSLIAFQGTLTGTGDAVTCNSPTFIAAVTTYRSTFDINATDPNTTALPTGLTVGTHAVAVGTTSAKSNARYTGATNFASTDDMRTAINTASNWTASNTDTTNFSGTFITPTVNLSVSTNTGTESGATVITITATATSAVFGNQTVNLNVGGTGISAADYTLSHATITIPNGNTTGSVTFTIVDDAEIEGNETAILTISSPSSGISLGSTATQNITITDNDAIITKIHTIQGNGNAVPDTSTIFTVEAIVTANYQASLSGFFIQEEDTEIDNNPTTSEGVFVSCNTCTTVVNVGDKVRITGRASENFDMSQLTPIAITVINSSNPLPTPATVILPVPSTFASKDQYLEQFEGMLIKIAGTLTVTENYQLGRFGQVTLAAGARPLQFTHVNFPSPIGYAAHQDTIARQTIVLDDATNAQNPDPIIYPQNNLSANNSLRSGSTINNLTGVLHWSWGGNPASSNTWRVRPVAGQPYDFTLASRPTTPPAIGISNVRIASFNLLNYFNSFSNCALGVGGATSTSNCRGAENAAEFARQKDKHKQVFSDLNADVIGLMELENDGYGATSAQQDLLNLAHSAGGRNYQLVNADTLIGSANALGTDAIKVGLIYDNNTVELVAGSVKTSSNAIFERRPLAATFKHRATNEKFTVVVNHLKSKGCDGSSGADTDQNDGQGCWNAKRKQQATVLTNFLSTLTDDPDILIIGDMNSYAQENPIMIIKTAGYTDLLGRGKYSYSFDGQIGSLDHALASASLVTQVTGADDWHINSDEPSALDYNTNFKSTGQITSFFNANPYRSSDHDPVLIGLNLSKPPNSVNSTPSYTVIVQTTGTGSGKVEQTAESSSSYLPKIKLTAIPDNGSQFMGWSERFAPECIGTNPIVMVTVNAIKTCIATFEKIPMKNQMINFAPLPVKTLGNADFSVQATATSGLPVDISSITPNICLINNEIVHLLNVGMCTLVARQSGNLSYFAAAPVSQSFLINPTDSSTQPPNHSVIAATKPQPSSQLRGVSANAIVGEQPIIVGILTTAKQRILVRASALDQVIDPEVVVLSYPDRNLLANNDNWNTGATAEELKQQQLAPACPSDAAMIMELPAGLFTVEMRSHQATAGIGLLELYDITVFSPELSQEATIQGISVNAVLGENPTIAGLLITGNSKRLLVRASGIDEIDPDVAIFSYPDRKLLANNAQWITVPTAAELTQKHLAPARQTDAAMIIALPPGLLTVEIGRQSRSAMGRAIIEVYDMNAFP